jgi:c-di-GMP-binding flagellar brake protein YcgR
MSNTQSITNKQPDQYLLDSIRKERMVVVTVNGSDGWSSFKSKFLPTAREGEAVGVEIIPDEHREIDFHAEAGTEIGVSFRVGHKKCMFGSIVESVQTKSDRVAVMFRWPESILPLRRRAFERAAVPEGVVVAVRFWRDDAASTTGADARTVRHGQLEDISAGGMRVRVASPDEIELGTVYRCAFTPKQGKPAILVDARVRHREAIGHGRASVGFQNVGLEVTAEGRRALERLTRVVSQYQRAQAQRRPRKKRGGQEDS